MCSAAFEHSDEILGVICRASQLRKLPVIANAYANSKYFFGSITILLKQKKGEATTSVASTQGSGGYAASNCAAGSLTRTGFTSRIAVSKPFC